MLLKANNLGGSTIQATDGEIGSVTTLFFDDDHWTVRYFVVETGGWLTGRKVLISPLSIRHAGSSGRSISTSLAREQVKNSPGIETARPVSRQHEVAYADYYGFPHYWAGRGVWGAAAMPSPMLARTDAVRAASAARTDEAEHDVRESHLRDASEVIGYHIHAVNGSIGHVEDFLIDDQSWTIRYLVVDTSNWIGGRRVLIASTWVSGIRWDGEEIDVTMPRDAIRNSPEYDAAGEVQRTYEERLHAHYAQPAYWTASDEESPAGEPVRDGDRFARLDQLDTLAVADGDADVRGWRVVASDGVGIGWVEHLIVDRPAMRVRYLETGLEPLHEEDGRRNVLIPIESVDIDASAREVRLPTLPSSRVPALPAFTGLPIDTDYAALCRTHFGPRGGAADADDRPLAGRRHTTSRGA